MTALANIPKDPKGHRTLIIGATGFMGRFIAEASLASGRPTYMLVRPDSTGLTKSNVVQDLQEKGAIALTGMMNDKETMERILKENEIEVVISVVGGANILDQLSLVEAIKSVGTIKRFLPSEFGHDVDRANPVEPGMRMYMEKRKVRRMVEEVGVPYTYICCNSIASWPYYDNTHPSQVVPPLDHFQIYGDAYFVAGEDIGRLTMKLIDDPRAVNKSVHFRPICNFLSMNELASLWEDKISRTLPRLTITEHDLLIIAAENQIPESIVASFTHDIFIKGCQVNFAINDPNEVEVTQLYPDEIFKTMDDWFDEFIPKLNV
ncbi:hypothetical protein RND81_07G030400 [Saponaria officinalis]|uniref:NmrA-like domain-containing protein n=1 Tax=Saponaria officinalis TaxID=3572 RepID=A0AAW1JN84_SAPOF